MILRLTVFRKVQLYNQFFMNINICLCQTLLTVRSSVDLSIRFPLKNLYAINSYAFVHDMSVAVEYLKFLQI